MPFCGTTYLKILLDYLMVWFLALFLESHEQLTQMSPL